MTPNPWGKFSIPVSCAIDLEQAGRNFRADTMPVGIDPQIEDGVRLHDAPACIDFGQSGPVPGKSNSNRASVLARFWTRSLSLFSLTDLYEVGF